MNLNSSQILLIVVIALIGIHYFFAPTKEGRGEEVIIDGDYRAVDIPNEGILLLPTDESKITSYDEAIFIVAGQYRANPVWFANSLPKGLKEKRYIVIVPYYADVDSSLGFGQQALEDETGYAKNYSSVIGFSAGGSNLMTWYDGQTATYDRVVLLDPALSESQSLADVGSEFIFLYGSPLHDNFRYYGDEYDALSEEVRNSGGLSEEINIDHYDFPEYFFNPSTDYVNLI
tara:strand:- start:4558 stop:5250 length:693 start_codon:yes stop_codon:yes gene_type:complete